MRKWEIVLREIHLQPYTVEAESYAEATDKVLEGEGERYLDDIVRVLERTGITNRERAMILSELRYSGTDEENPFEEYEERIDEE